MLNVGLSVVVNGKKKFFLSSENQEAYDEQQERLASGLAGIDDTFESTEDEIYSAAGREESYADAASSALGGSNADPQLQAQMDPAGTQTFGRGGRETPSTYRFDPNKQRYQNEREIEDNEELLIEDEVPSVNEAPTVPADPAGMVEELHETISNMINTTLLPEPFILYDTDPNNNDSFDPAGENISNTTLYELKEALNSEGFSEEFPQIIAMTEFKNFFTAVGAEDQRSISLSELSEIIDNVDLRETAVSKLLEIQTHVKRMCSRSTTDLFNIFNINFTKQQFANSKYSRLKNLINDIQQINRESGFLNDVSYDFSNDYFEIEDVLNRLKESGNAKAAGLVEFISENAANPYVLAVLRYFILTTFATSILSLLQVKLESQGSFLNSFYTDVVINSDISDRDLKNVFDNLGLSMNDYDNFLKNIFVADLPVSAQVARLIKAIHAIGSGFIMNSQYKIYNNDNLDEANGLVTTKIKSFLENSRKMRYESFIKHAYLHNSYEGRGNSNYETAQTDPTSIIATLSPYFFDRDLNLNNYGDLIRGLMPLVCDIKNSLGFQNESVSKDAQVQQIEAHLHPAGLNSDLIKNNKFTNINTEKDVLMYFDNSIDINFSSDQSVEKSIINTADFKDLVYQNHDGKTIIILDTNGILHQDESLAVGENQVKTLREFAFSLDDFTGENMNKVYQKINPAVKNITNQFKRYGIKNLSQTSHVTEDYFENLFNNLAEMIQDLRFLNTTSDTRLMEAIALTFSATSEQINKKTFSAAAILHHNITLGNGTGVSRSVIGIPGTGVVVLPKEMEDIGYGTSDEDYVTSAGSESYTDPEDKVAVKINNAQAYIGGEAATHVSEDNMDEYYATVKRSVFDFLFAAYFDRLIPGTQVTIGGGGQDDDAGEESSLDQIFLDSAYKNMNRDKPRSYDGDSGNLKYLWNKSKNNTTQKIGTPKTVDLSIPSKADTEYSMNGTWNITQVNQPFKRMFDFKESSNNQLLRFAFSYDEDFLNEQPGISTLLNIDDFGNKQLDIAYGSTSLARSYLLYFLIVKIFSTSLSFTFETTGLEGRDGKEKNHEQRTISIHYNIDQFVAMYDALKGNEPDSAKYANEAKPVYKKVFDNVKNIRDYALGKVEFHDNGMVIALAAFNKISDYFRKFRDKNNVSASDDSQTFTASSYLNSLNTQQERFFDYYNIDQFKLSAISLQRMMQPSKNNFYLPSSKDITDKQIAAMRKYFSYSGEYSPGSIPRNRFAGTFNEESNISSKKYILHVGITNNMLSRIRETQIRNFSVTTGIKLSEIEKQDMRDQYNRKSIIKINLFRKNMMNGEEVSVKSYLFDTSKFIVENVKDPKFAEVHTSLARSNVKLTDFIKSHRFFHVDNAMNIHRMTIARMLTLSPEQDFEKLEESEINDLIMNHLNDHYLKMYCKTVLGIDYDEDIYHFSTALETTLSAGYDRGFSETNYQNAFARPINNAISTTNRSLLQERNRIESEAQRSIFFSPKKYLNRTILPKTFDRVFALYLNMDELDINTEQTQVSNEGVFLDQFYCTIQLTPKVLLPGTHSLPADFVKTPAGQAVLNTSQTLLGTLNAAGFFE